VADAIVHPAGATAPASGTTAQQPSVRLSPSGG